MKKSRVEECLLQHEKRLDSHFSQIQDLARKGERIAESAPRHPLACVALERVAKNGNCLMASHNGGGIIIRDGVFLSFLDGHTVMPGADTWIFRVRSVFSPACVSVGVYLLCDRHTLCTASPLMRVDAEGFVDLHPIFLEKGIISGIAFSVQQ